MERFPAKIRVAARQFREEAAYLGSYRNHSFLLYMNGADCDKTVDDVPFKFEKLSCKSLDSALPAVGSFVALDIAVTPNDAIYSKLLETISDFLLWGIFNR